MRISGGDARGIRLRVPKGARPVSERVRQAIFSSLAGEVDGARVLDLYCGSGAYGLEALSRGAAFADLVDGNRRALDVARANAEAAGLKDRVRLHRRDAAAFARTLPGEPPDLVFLDPPYNDTGALVRVLRALAGVLVAGGLVVAEQRWSAGEPPSDDAFILEDDRRYGDTRVLMYRRPS